MTTHTANAGLKIQQIEGKGRGVIGAPNWDSYIQTVLKSTAATQPIPAQTLVEVSPVLLFKPEEYREHGKYTIPDEFTFTWPSGDGTMALALGIGV
jgi:tRNA-specific adenosine deaminase 3